MFGLVINECFVFQVVARLLAFMLFTLYWGPGNFYPLMIFVVIHMILGGTLHIVFSEDLAFYRNGNSKTLDNIDNRNFVSLDETSSINN